MPFRLPDIVRSIVLLLALAPAAAAQLPDYHLQVFGYTQGIRAGNINAVSRDADGYVWILYPRAVQRFDGKRVREFRLEDFVNFLFCDDRGGVWVSSGKRVYRFLDDFRQFRPIPVLQADSSGVIGPLFQLPDRSVWVLCTTGFYRLSEAGDRFLPADADPPLAKPYGTRSFGFCGHTVFFRKADSLYAYNLQTRRLAGLPDRAINRILPLDEQTVLVNTWDNETFRYDFAAGRVSAVTLPPGGRVMTVRDVAPLGNGRYFLLAREGVFSYEQKTGRIGPLSLYRDGRPVYTNDFAHTLYYDRDGDIWMGSIDGLARLSTRRQTLGLIRIVQPGEASPSAVSNVRRIVADADGKLWMATGHGLVCWDLRTGRRLFFPPDPDATDRLNYPSLRGLVFDGRYLIIGAANRGVWLLDPRTHRFRHPQYASDRVRQRSENDFMDEVTTLQNGKHLLTGRDDLYVLDGKTYTLDILEAPGSRDNTNFAFQTPDGIVWLATVKGLHCLDADLNYLQEVDLGGKNTFITCGFVNSRGELLFATAGGLFSARYEQGRPRVDTVGAAFANLLINALYQDQNGIVWACGESGISRFDPATGRLNVLDYSDNVQGYGFNPDSWFRHADGTVFFGGTNGINYLVPETYPEPSDALAVFIHRVKINDNDTLYYTLGPQPELAYEQRSIELEFSAPYFNNPDKINYRYRLDGLDTAWKSLGNNHTLRLTSLPPGAYHLRLQASLNGVDWVESRRGFAFTIAAPYWQRTWFLALAAALSAAAVFALLRYSNRRRREKETARRILLESQQKMKEAEMQALRAQMNPHFIFNCLNSINRYIVKSDQATASLYLTRFAKLIRLILDNSNSIQVALASDLEALRLYIDMELLRFDEKFTYDITVDPSVNPDSIQVPPLIIQPYVENAIWHGLLHKATAGHLHIHLRMLHDNLLECVVEDNGVGREKAGALKSKSATTRKSLGIQLTENRLVLLNKYAQLNARADIADLKDADGRAAGTRVTLTIPV